MVAFATRRWATANLSSAAIVRDPVRMLGGLGHDCNRDRRSLLHEWDGEPKESLERGLLLLAVLRSVHRIGLCMEGHFPSFEIEERYAHVEADCHSRGGRVARC